MKRKPPILTLVIFMLIIIAGSVAVALMQDGYSSTLSYVLLAIVAIGGAVHWFFSSKATEEIQDELNARIEELKQAAEDNRNEITKNTQKLIGDTQKMIHEQSEKIRNIKSGYDVIMNDFKDYKTKNEKYVVEQQKITKEIEQKLNAQMKYQLEVQLSKRLTELDHVRNDVARIEEWQFLRTPVQKKAVLTKQHSKMSKLNTVIKNIQTQLNRLVEK